MLTNADLIRVGICIAFGLILCGLRLKLVLYVDAIFCIVNAMPGLVWLLSQKSMDVTVRTALGVSRLVSCGGAFIVMSVAHARSDIYTSFHLLYSVLPFGLWALVMLVQLIRTGSRVNIKLRKVDTNSYLVTDMMLLLTIGILHIACPGLLYGLVGLNLDDVHVYLHRVNGAVMLGLASHAWVGQRFRYPEDKHHLLFSRLLCMLLWAGRVALAYTNGQLPAEPGAYAYIGTVAAILLPSFLGCALTENGPFTAAYWTAEDRRNLNVPPSQESVPAT